MSEDDIYGQCTVIVARSGPVDLEADGALLRATEAALGLAPDSVPRDPGMDRPEFRLVEGIDRTHADRVAAAAVRAGFTPRVRDRLGIKYSSERSSGTAFLAMVATLVGIAALASATEVYASAMLVMAVAVLFGGSAFRRSIALPLIVARGMLAAQPGRAAPQAEAARTSRDPVDAGVSDGVRQARRALERLGAALGSSDVPAPVRADLSTTHAALAARVDQLEAAATGSDETSAAVLALRARYDELRGRIDADPGELDRLATALAAEDAAQDDAASRRAATLTDLLAIRRVVASAVDGLQHSESPGDPAAALASQVERLTGVGKEVAAIRAVAARARRSKPQTE